MKATATLLVLAVAYFAAGTVGQNIDGITNCLKQFGFSRGIMNAVRNNPMMMPQMNPSQLCYAKCWLDVMNLTNGASSFMPTNALNSVPFLSAIRTAAQNIPGMNMIMNQTKLLSLIRGCNPNGAGDCMMSAKIARCVISMLRPNMITQYMNSMNPIG